MQKVTGQIDLPSTLFQLLKQDKEVEIFQREYESFNKGDRVFVKGNTNRYTGKFVIATVLEVKESTIIIQAEKREGILKRLFKRRSSR